MRRNIFSPIEIRTFDTDVISCKPEYNTYFELVFVEKGRGFRFSDDLKLPFKKNDFFLHLPRERNSIHLEELSVIHFIKFQKSFFFQKGDKDFSASNWFLNVEFILNSNQQKELSIIKDSKELSIVKSIIELLIYESNVNAPGGEANIKPLLITLLNITLRNILSHNIPLSAGPRATSMQDILNYIHIHDPKQLSVPLIARAFCMSERYFGEYFSSNIGMSYKQYILKYKVKLATSKLRYSDLTLSEIAFELGFTDISHLNKTYKKICGLYPREIRN